jgi:hypothetical protein
MRCGNRIGGQCHLLLSLPSAWSRLPVGRAALAALRIGEYHIEGSGLAKRVERVAHPQVNELWPGTPGGQGRRLRVLFRW